MMCESCGKSETDRPSIFRNEKWCSDRCRKAVQQKELKQRPIKRKKTK